MYPILSTGNFQNFLQVRHCASQQNTNRAVGLADSVGNFFGRHALHKSHLKYIAMLFAELRDRLLQAKLFLIF